MDSHGTDVPARSPAEPGEETPSATGLSGQAHPASDDADLPQADVEQPAEPLPAQAPTGMGTDYAGAGFSAQAQTAEQGTEHSAPEDYGGPPAADETFAPDVGDETYAEPAVVGVPERDVVVLGTEEPAGNRDPQGGTASAERWSEIKAMFVDEPRASVNLASGLVEQAIQDLAATVRQRHDSLAPAWQTTGDAASTEQLRKALLGYRALFDQLDQMSRQVSAQRPWGADA